MSTNFGILKAGRIVPPQYLTMDGMSTNFAFCATVDALSLMNVSNVLVEERVLGYQVSIHVVYKGLGGSLCVGLYICIAMIMY